jgi:hypothetical protein
LPWPGPSPDGSPPARGNPPARPGTGGARRVIANSTSCSRVKGSKRTTVLNSPRTVGSAPSRTTSPTLPWNSSWSETAKAARGISKRGLSSSSTWRVRSERVQWATRSPWIFSRSSTKTKTGLGAAATRRATMRGAGSCPVAHPSTAGPTLGEGGLAGREDQEQLARQFGEQIDRSSLGQPMTTAWWAVVTRLPDLLEETALPGARPRPPSPRCGGQQGGRDAVRLLLAPDEIGELWGRRERVVKGSVGGGNARTPPRPRGGSSFWVPSSTRPFAPRPALRVPHDSAEFFPPRWRRGCATRSCPDATGGMASISK